MKDILKKYKGIAYFCDGKDVAPLKLGDRIRKINTQKGDNHLDGATGMILGSISQFINNEYGYAVIWDDNVNIVVCTVGSKLEKEKEKEKLKIGNIAEYKGGKVKVIKIDKDWAKILIMDTGISTHVKIQNLKFKND